MTPPLWCHSLVSGVTLSVLHKLFLCDTSRWCHTAVVGVTQLFLRKSFLCDTSKWCHTISNRDTTFKLYPMQKNVGSLLYVVSQKNKIF